MKTTVINIYGAPGSGKSTLAAELYAEMKKYGKSVELVREAIKPWAYEGKKPTVFEQIYITNKQMLEETSLYGKVDYLITDSPVALGDFYCQYYHNCDSLKYLWGQTYIEASKRQLVNRPIEFFIPIDENLFQQEGRYSNLEESKLIQEKMINDVIAMGYTVGLSQTETRCKDALRVINEQITTTE